MSQPLFGEFPYFRAIIDGCLEDTSSEIECSQPHILQSRKMESVSSLILTTFLEHESSTIIKMNPLFLKAHVIWVSLSLPILVNKIF